MSVQWYYSRQGKQLGPFTPEALKQLAISGNIEPNDPVWRDGSTQRIPANKVKGLLSVNLGDTTAAPSTPIAQQQHAPTTVTPPPLPLTDDVSDGDGGSSVPPPLTSEPPPVPAEPLPIPLAAESAQHDLLRTLAVATPAPLDQKQLAQKVQQLRHDIVHHVLGSDPRLPTSPLVAAIRTEHGQVRDRIGKCRDRMSQLDAKKSLYGSLYKACEKAQKELAGAEAQLESLARQLGHAAFLAHRAGEIGNQPCFAERLALQATIEALQAEYAQLVPSSDASFFQKTKAKAQQLVVAGKIKYKELKIGSLETHLGKSLLDSGMEQTVACATTAAPLDQVCQQRTAIAKLHSESEAARSALDSKKQEFCRALGLSTIENARTFDTEIRECQSRIGQAQKDLATQEDGIPGRLVADQGEMGVPLVGLLGELRRATEQMTLLGQKGGSPTAMEPPGPIGSNQTATYAVAFTNEREWVERNRLFLGKGEAVFSNAAVVFTGHTYIPFAGRKSLAIPLTDIGSTVVEQKKVKFQYRKNGRLHTFLFYSATEAEAAAIAAILPKQALTSPLSPASTSIPVPSGTDEPNITHNEIVFKTVKAIGLICAVLLGIFLLVKAGSSLTSLVGHASGKTPGFSADEPKLAAFRKVVEKYKQMPDILDGETKRKNFNKELEVLQDEYFKIPFEPTKNRDEAKQIVKLFQEELEGKYSGWQYSLLDENIRGHIISPLLH